MHRRSFLLGLSALMLARPAHADDVDAALADIAKARAGIQTLVAPFTQERIIGLLATAVKSEGEMILVRPDRLRWELKPPDAITYWITPEGLAYATPNGSSSVGKGAAGRFGAVLGDLMTLLGGDLAKLRARYDLAAERKPTGLVLTARPTAEEVKKHVKSLTLAVAPDLWTVQRIEIEESGGDRSVITFGKIQRDVKVDPAKMVPPKR
ncbi:MAG: outer membrane lipoprotein carrier protein LolA [Minicystis sp.]